MEQLSVGHVQKLIEGLYNSTDPRTAKDVQEQLQAIQRLPQAWGIAPELLSIQSDQCRFFGAHTFQVKISRDWDTLPEDRIDWLRDEILVWIVRLCAGPMLVTTKLCLALISFALHAVPNHWHSFVAESVDALRRGGAVYGVATQNIDAAILEFLTLVPEEISNTELAGNRKLQLIQELNDAVPLVLSVLSSVLFTTSYADGTAQQKALRCFQSWIQYGIEFEASYPIIQQTMRLLTKEDTFEPATEVLLEAMQQPSWARYVTLRDDLLKCFTSEEMKNQFTTCISGMSKLFTAFGETFAEFISVQLPRHDVLLLMDMIMQLTAFHGHFPADQEVSEIPLNFWYVLQEVLFDNGIAPIRDDSYAPSLDGDDDASLDKTMPSEEQRIWTRQCGEAAVIIYRQLVTILQQKAAFPEDSVWASWAQDLKDKFRICRRDLGDTMINPYYILRGEMLAILLEHAIAVINHWDSIPLASQDLEATLFCLKSISEEISPGEDEHIHRFFGPEVFGRFPRNGSIRLQNTTILLMGSLAEWLKKHPQFLAPVMNYLVPCLSIPKLAPSAASAFSDICDACRNSLVDDLDSLMNIYNAMSHSQIEASVVESIANVIQVLPMEIAITPILTLTGNILQSAAEALEIAKTDQERARLMILTQIQYLSACCKGIQSPNDDYQSMSARLAFYDSFASGKSIAAFSDIEGLSQINDAMRKLTREIAGIWNGDEKVMKALSLFLESGVRSVSPVLALPFLDLVMIIQASYQSAPFPCWLDTAKFVITVYGGQDAYFQNLRELLQSLTVRTLEFITNPKDMEQSPDVVDSYFDLLSAVLKRCPIVFYQLSYDQINTIFMFCIAGMGLQERLALKAAVNFMAEFVGQEYEEGTEIGAIVNTLVTNMGPQIIEKLLVGIGGHVPRSFSGPLVDVLFKMTIKYTQACREWLPILLLRDGFPSALVTDTEKIAFIKGIIGTRSLKKFKDVVNTFSVKCRGLSNTSFGAV
ncbi:armadillo-type protein [Phycomyces blakesleeanus]|uniref:Importin-13 n=1 Tax=Phycomyces blakesleeanus TaxID=4837 RepID=A0ABR3ANV4_PHYBL